MSELVTLNNQTLTLSSLEIAELTGKRHDNVMTDIRKMLAALDIKAPDFSGTYKTDRGNTYECFHLPKRETLILVSGYRVDMRAKIIDRWQELEAKQLEQFDVPKTLPDALRLAANLVEENVTLKIDNEEKTHLIKSYKPKVDYLEQILSSNSLITITQIAKDYGLSGRAMNELLHEIGIQYRINNQWLLYRQYQKEGYTHSGTVTVKHNDRVSEVKLMTKWTQKGRLFLYDSLKAMGILPLIEEEAA